MANKISSIKLPDNSVYDFKDNGALQLTGGTVTGPVNFNNSISAIDITTGDFIATGNTSFTNPINGKIKVAESLPVGPIEVGGYGFTKAFKKTLLMCLGRTNNIYTSFIHGTTAPTTEGQKIGTFLNFQINAPILYQDQADYENGSIIPDGVCKTTAENIDIRYMFNVDENWGTAGKPLYLVGRYQRYDSDKHYFYIGDYNMGTRPTLCTNIIPVEDPPYGSDTTVYLYLGQMTSPYQFTLSNTHPLYTYKRGMIAPLNTKQLTLDDISEPLHGGGSQNGANFVRKYYGGNLYVDSSYYLQSNNINTSDSISQLESMLDGYDEGYRQRRLFAAWHTGLQSTLLYQRGVEEDQDEEYFGAILRWGGSSPYLYMLRHNDDCDGDDNWGWVTTSEWEKISAGYADSAGTANTATKWTSAQKVYVALGTASTTTVIQGGNPNAETIGVNGVLKVAQGGTGKTTGKDAANYFLNSLDTNTSTPVDADYYISQYVNGGTTTTTYHRRPMSALWTYVKGKTDTLYVPYSLFDPRASYGTTIASNSNLDADCNEVGTYRSDQASTSQSLTGTVPVTSSGFKIFNIGGYGTKQRQQFLVHNSATDIMYRGSTNIGDSSTWSKWYKIVSLPSGSDNKTFSAVGSSTQPVYVNANGQVIACTSYANASVASAKYLITEGDNRSVATSPNDYTNTGGLPNRIAFRGLKNNTYIGSPSSDVYSYLVGLRGWSDDSGGNAHEIAFNNTGIFVRKGSSSTWGAWGRLLDSNNFSSYALPLTGGTVKGNITFDSENLTNEYGIRVKVRRKTTEREAGWSSWLISCIDASDTDFAHFGIFGVADEFKYIYIGTGAHDSTANLRVYADGKVQADNYVGTWNGNTIIVGKGGTGATSFASGELLIGNGTNAIGTRAIKNITAKNNLGWTSSTGTQIPTLNTLAYWDGRYNATSSNLTYSVKGAFGDASTKGVVTMTNGGISDVGATDNDIPTTASVVDYVGRIMTSAVTLKGTIGTGGNFTTLPSFYKIGWAYRVISAGTYAGQTCEIGDLIVAIKDSGSSSSNSDWTVMQNNIDGAITESGGTINGTLTVDNSFYANSATLGNLIVNGTSSFVDNMQVNSINGVTVGASPKFTDTTYSNKAAVQNGTEVSLVTTGQKYTWNSKTSNTGTVTSVQIQANSPLQSSTSTAQTNTLNTTISFIKQNANTVLAGPSSGSTAAAPSFRTLVASDIPNLTVSKISDFPTSWALSSVSGADDLKAIEALAGTSGFLKKTAANTWTLDTNTYVTSSGVTSITLTGNNGVSITNSGTAITTTGTRTISLADNYGDTKNPYASKTKNYVLAAPNGSNGVPSFRALVGADLPLATTAARGCIQIGYSSTGQKYAVQLSNEKAYVEVPWVNTTYSLTIAMDTIDTKKAIITFTS